QPLLGCGRTPTETPHSQEFLQSHISTCIVSLSLWAAGPPGCSCHPSPQTYSMQAPELHFHSNSGANPVDAVTKRELLPSARRNKHEFFVALRARPPSPSGSRQLMSRLPVAVTQRPWARRPGKRQ